MARPVIFVLAGVNGAGKSSILGLQIEASGSTWFNPDDFARDLRALVPCDEQTANSAAWSEGMRRLERAVATQSDYAFETTLGGNTVRDKLLAASGTHDIYLWYCGLSSVELHLDRIKDRVAKGGHNIPEPKVRARYMTAPENLITLLPHIFRVKVYDNSQTVGLDEPIPDPVLLLEVHKGKVVYPLESKRQQVPEWAQAIVNAAFAIDFEKSGGMVNSTGD